MFIAPPGTPPPNMAREDEDGNLRLYSVDETGITEWTSAGLRVICRECKAARHDICVGYALDTEKDVVTGCECPHLGGQV